MNITKDFRLFAKDHNVSMSVYDDVVSKTNNGGITNPYNSLTPVILEERQLHASPVDIYSRMLLDRIIFFGNEFSNETCNIVTAELLYLDSIGNKDINIYISSPGGDVAAGLSNIAVIQYIKSSVATTCVGTAASMAAVLLSCGEKGKRFILPYGRVMVHDIASGFRGKYRDIEIDFENTQSYRDDIFNILAANTGKSYDEIKEICARDYWMKGEKAVEFGIVDKIIATTK